MTKNCNEEEEEMPETFGGDIKADRSLGRRRELTSEKPSSSRSIPQLITLDDIFS